jgi:hypothetical protein
MFYPEIAWAAPSRFASPGPSICPTFAARIRNAYRVACQDFKGHGASGWAWIEGKNADLHASLVDGDLADLAARLSDPRRTDLFFGFDHLCRSLLPADKQVYARQYEPMIGDMLLRLAESVGATPVWNPESMGTRIAATDIDALLDATSSALEVPIDFPNPFTDEFGLASRRGIISIGAIHAVYYASRLRELSRVYGGRVLEIGPGMGRTAYYARLMGLRDYTTVDLPLGNVAQAVFLGQALPPDAVAMPGEPARPDQIKIATPSSIAGNFFDLVFNSDSLPEMDRRHAEAYADEIVGSAKAFLSINHEAGTFNVRDLPQLENRRVWRSPYWLRQGYVEEFFVM